VQHRIRYPEFFKLALLCFTQGAAGAIWMVPLSSVLDAHGLTAIKPMAFATSALAAMVSPLIFGAVADRHMSPVRVLRWLAVTAAAAMASVSFGIQQGWNPWVVLCLIQLFALSSSPMGSISATIVFERLADARKQFGPIRAMFTIGWMAGALLVSALNADSSSLAGFTGAITLLLVAGSTFLLPITEMPRFIGPLKWHERLGLDALALLKKPDHRVMFLTTLLLSIPLAAFYPQTPAQLRALGFEHTSAWMSLGQVSEIFAMFTLGSLLLKHRLKWILLVGLGFSLVRFVLCAIGTNSSVLLGIFLHGFSYTLVYITAQIYLERRVDQAWRARAQALMALLNGGLGNLLGYLGTGWWMNACTPKSGTPHWPIFWGGLALGVAGVTLYFLIAYRGRAGISEISASQPLSSQREQTAV